VGKGQRLAIARARESSAVPQRVSSRLPSTVEEAVAAYLADRRGELVQEIDDESAIVVSTQVAHIQVLGELADQLGPLVKDTGDVHSLKSRPGERPLEHAAHLRRLITPPGWEERLKVPLEELAAKCLEKILKLEDVEHSRAKRSEVLRFLRFLARTDAEGRDAESRIAAERMRADGGR